MMEGLKIYNKSCKNCLFSNNRIVSKKLADKLIDKCIEEDDYFVCHKASINNDIIVCKTFYDKYHFKIPILRLATIWNFIAWIDQTDSKQLPSYKENNGK